MTEQASRPSPDIIAPVEPPLKFARNRSVFVNCPFDQDYVTIFDGIIFSVVCSGYMPRSALETDQVSELRIKKLHRQLGPRNIPYMIYLGVVEKVI